MVIKKEVSEKVAGRRLIGILRAKVLLTDAKYVLCFHAGIPDSPWSSLHFGHLHAHSYDRDRIRP